MATTTNYAWETPDDTDLVKDGAAAIRTLGSSIDTTTKALNPSTTLGDIEYRSSTANTNTRLGIGTSGQVLTVSGGVPAWTTISSGPTFVGCKVYKSSSQTVSAISTYTALTWNAESFDTDAFHDNSTNNSRITIPTGKGGKYLFTFVAALSTAQVKRVGWYKNGTRVESAIAANSNYSGGVTFSYLDTLSAGDYVEVFVWNDSSTIYYSSAEYDLPTYLSAIYLGA